MNEVIGTIQCRFCSEKVELKESKKGKCYYNCKNCGQFFARNLDLDKKLREQAVTPGDEVEPAEPEEGGKENDILDF